MWWNNLKEIKKDIAILKSAIARIEGLFHEDQFRYNCGYIDIGLIIQKCFQDAFESEEEFNSINRIHDKLNLLIDDERRKQEIELSLKTLDKFEDYMKNVDKLNNMINEFKGCVSLARSALEERKQLDAQKSSKIEEKLDKITEILHKMTKKPAKKRKSTKKAIRSP